MQYKACIMSYELYIMLKLKIRVFFFKFNIAPEAIVGPIITLDGL